MMRKLHGTWLIPLALACVALPLALAADPKKDKDDPEDRLVQAQDAMASAAQLQMACELEAFGIENKAPDALITAGRLLLMLPRQMRALDEKIKDKTAELEPGKDNDGKPGTTVKAEDYDARATRLFAKAEELAGKNPGIKALIEDAKQTKPPGTKGRLSGPASISRTLGAGGKDVWRFRFQKGLPGYISVSANQRLHIEIIRPNGVYIANVNFRSASANFTPPNEELWTIVVHNNLVNKANSYTLTTN